LFVAVQEAIASKYGDPPKEPASIAKKSYGAISLGEAASLFDNLDKLQTCSSIVNTNSNFPTFEDLGFPSGFVLYRRSSSMIFSSQTLRFNSHIVHDRVQVFVDGSWIDTVYRRDGESAVDVPAGMNIDFLVENMGRINYGQGMYDFKGLIMKPPVNGTWNAYCLPLDYEAVKGLPFSQVASRNGNGKPLFRRGSLHISGAPNDTFFDTTGLTKGLIWINGHNIGRYWATAGPQYTLYVPAPFLNSGDNEVIVLDLEGSTATTIMSVGFPHFPAMSSSAAENVHKV